MDYLQQADQGVVQVYPCPSKLQAYQSSAQAPVTNLSEPQMHYTFCICINLSCCWCAGLCAYMTYRPPRCQYDPVTDAGRVIVVDNGSYSVRAGCVSFPSVTYTAAKQKQKQY
jgi:hypothetical protein